MQGKEFNKPLFSKELWLIFMTFGIATYKIYSARHNQNTKPPGVADPVSFDGSQIRCRLTGRRSGVV